MVHDTPAPPTKSVSGTAASDLGGSSPASGYVGCEHDPSRQLQTIGQGQGLGSHRSTHAPRTAPPSATTGLHTRFGGQTTPAQSSTHWPAAQCAPP